jgi:hypothetical protein
VPLTVKDLAEENIEIARKSAKAAEKRIYDWMVECQHAAEMRKVIDDAARIGVGVLKGPIPAAKKQLAVTKSNGAVAVLIKQQVKPVTAGATRGTSFRTRPVARTSTTATSSSSAISCRTARSATSRMSRATSRSRSTRSSRKARRADKDSDAGAKEARAPKAKGRFEVWYYYGSLKREEMGTIWTAAGKSLEKTAQGQRPRSMRSSR